MSKKIYDVTDIRELLDCRTTKAYNVIKMLNNELLAAGSKVTAGKVPANYFHERFKGFKNTTGNTQNY